MISKKQDKKAEETQTRRKCLQNTKFVSKIETPYHLIRIQPYEFLKGKKKKNTLEPLLLSVTAVR